MILKNHLFLLYYFLILRDFLLITWNQAGLTYIQRNSSTEVL